MFQHANRVYSKQVINYWCYIWEISIFSWRDHDLNPNVRYDCMHEYMVKWPPRLISLIETDQYPILCHAANDSIVELSRHSAYQSKATALNFLDLIFLL